MTSTLYEEIVASIRGAIYAGDLKPGDDLPTVRDMSEQWDCAPGTVQRAYRELARQGLVSSRPGQGTQVAARTPSSDPLRRAALANEAEAFLLGVLSGGYTVNEVEQALRLALDRWRAITQEIEPTDENVIRFVGSHDPLISTIADYLAPGHRMQIAFVGSLGGLIALAEQKAEVAGCHLWDEESDSYNLPFVRRLLPGRRTALFTLAHRRLGFITASGNPLGIEKLSDLTSSGARFINRQPGAGTRVWLDAQLRHAGIESGQIVGYDQHVMTHTEVGRAIAEGLADVGLGIEAAALAYGLDFHFLTSERYDLVIPESVWASAAIQEWVGWLAGPQAREVFAGFDGYDFEEAGAVRWS